MAGKWQSVRRKMLIFSTFSSSGPQLSDFDVSGPFLEPSKSPNFSFQSADSSNFQVRFLKKSAERAWFKTAKNPTSRRPSESIQEALNSFLTHWLGGFDRFSTISIKIPIFRQGSSQGEAAWLSPLSSRGQCLLCSSGRAVVSGMALVVGRVLTGVVTGGQRGGPQGGILVEIVENLSKQTNQCLKRPFRAF